MAEEKQTAEQTLMSNAVKKLVAFYDKGTGGGGSVAAARDTIITIVKKYMEEFPEINDENVIFRCCLDTVQMDCNMLTHHSARKMKDKFSTIIVKSTLKESDLREIFELLKATFYDLAFFDSLIGEKLWLFLQHSNSFEITEASTKRCAERYYDVTTFDDPTKPERKIVLNQIRLVFKCCTVLLLGYHPLLRSYRWTSVDELIRQYPDFAEVKERQELQYLLAFRNIVRVALLVIPPLSNKQLLLNIGGRLEGSGNEYITGTGQKICVTRRVAIYEQEGRVTSQKKKPKTPQLSQLVQPQTQSQQQQQQQQQQKLEQSTSSGSASNANGTGSGAKHQNTHEYVSSNKVKKIRLGEEDIKELSKPTPLLNPETLRSNSVFSSSSGTSSSFAKYSSSSSAIVARQPPAYSGSSSSSSSSASVLSTSSSSVPSAAPKPFPSRQISELKDLKLSSCGTDYPPTLPPTTTTSNTSSNAPAVVLSDAEASALLKRQSTDEYWRQFSWIKDSDSRNISNGSYKSVFNSSDSSICRKVPVYSESASYLDMLQDIEPVRALLSINNDICSGSLINDLCTLYGFGANCSPSDLKPDCPDVQ